jgi:hypothetical protein
MPARLTSSLLVRKGEAAPSDDRDAPAGALVQSLPAGSALTRPATPRAPMVEFLVPGRAAMPTTAGSGCSGEDDQVKLTVRLDRTLHTRLRVLAARQQRTNHDIVQGALEAYLNVFGVGCPCLGSAKPKA